MLLRVAAAGGLGRDEVVEAGREQGDADAEALARAARPPRRRRRGRRHVRRRPDGPPRRARVRPRAGAATTRAVTVGFAHCPFRELAEANPEIVCGLHQGLVEGIVDGLGGADVDEFHPLTDRTPCQVDLALAGS